MDAGSGARRAITETMIDVPLIKIKPQTNTTCKY